MCGIFADPNVMEPSVSNGKVAWLACRRQGLRADLIPMLNRISPEGLPPVSELSGQDLLAEVLRQQDEPVSLIMTGGGGA